MSVHVQQTVEKGRERHVPLQSWRRGVWALARTADVDVRPGRLPTDADHGVAAGSWRGACDTEGAAEGDSERCFANPAVACAGFWCRERSVPPESERCRCEASAWVPGIT